MRELIDKWRAEAVSLNAMADRLAGIDYARADGIGKQAELSSAHADELERAWHDYAHDASFKPECPICDKEREQYA